MTLALFIAGVYTQNSSALGELDRYFSACERQKENLLGRFRAALSKVSGELRDGARNGLSSELFDITTETCLALDLERDTAQIEQTRAVLDQQHLMRGLGKAMNNMKRGLLMDSVIVQTTNDLNKALDEQVQKLESLQKSAKETNTSLLVLLDLKQRQAAAIEVTSAREQSVLSRHQNQTLMVFTVVTVSFLPLSFIATFLAISISELPHDSSGNQQMSLGFALRYVLRPGLGFAFCCVLIAFFGTIKRTCAQVCSSGAGQRKIAGSEMGMAIAGLKAKAS